MTVWHYLALAAALYAAFVLALVVAGRRDAARAVAGFIPDCIALVRRLLADPEVPRRHKLLLLALIAYLLCPIDLVPDFIPVAGQLDDAILVVVVLRVVLRGTPIRSALWPTRASSTSPPSRSPAEARSGASTS